MKLVVLDCDGTLVDSQNGICEAMTHAFTGLRPRRADARGDAGHRRTVAAGGLRCTGRRARRGPRAQMVRALQIRLPRDPPRPGCTSRCLAASPRPSKPSASAMTSCSASPPASRARASTGCSSARAGRTGSSPCRRPTIIPQSPIRHAARRHGGDGRNAGSHGYGRRHDLRYGDGAGGRRRRAGRRLGLPLDRRAARGRRPRCRRDRATASPPTSTPSSRAGEGRVTEPADKRRRRARSPAGRRCTRRCRNASTRSVDVREEPGGELRDPSRRPRRADAEKAAAASARRGRLPRPSRRNGSAQTERIDPGTHAAVEDRHNHHRRRRAERGRGGSRNRPLRRQRSPLLPRRGARARSPSCSRWPGIRSCAGSRRRPARRFRWPRA